MSSHAVGTAVITGAAGGIGHALATRLAGTGHDLELVDIDGDRVEKVARDLAPARGISVDVADPAAMDELARAAGEVDLLCLNAGVVSSEMGAPWEASADEWNRVLGVNLGGVVNGLRSFVPSMLERGSEASILITVSLAGAATWPGGGPYAASKHAALAVAEQAALGLADTPLTVTALCPALVSSGMSPDGEDPLDVADQALAAVADGRFAVIPDMWAAAVRKRGEDLAAGRQPDPPTPT